LGTAFLELTIAPALDPPTREWTPVATSLLVIAGVAFVYGQTLSQTVPLALTLREDAGQVRIAWNPSAAAGGAKLEILDGGNHTTVFVGPPLADVTYAARSGDVQVRLTASTDGRMEIARFLVREPSPTELAAEFAVVFAKAHSARRTIWRENEDIDDLEEAAREIDSSTSRPEVKRVPPRETMWWR
jgi:hypothetical protein